MKSKQLSVVILSLLLVLVLSSCNLPSRKASSNPSSTPARLLTSQAAPTPASWCNNPFFPTRLGDTWEYSGSNTATGAYSRTDTVSNLSNAAFSIETKSAGVIYSVKYTCSPEGLEAADPVQQYAGAILGSPDTPVNIKLGNVAGTTLPATISPGDTWQQTADFEASSSKQNMSGRLVFNYTAVGYEGVTVPSGSYNALHVDLTIRIEVTALHILAGTYTVSLWYAPDVGLAKSQGASHVPGADFTDSLELTHFSHSP